MGGVLLVVVALLFGSVASLQPGTTTTTLTKSQRKAQPRTVRNFAPESSSSSPGKKKATTSFPPSSFPLKAALFSGGKRKPKQKDVVVPRDFTLTLVIAAVAAYLDQIPYVQYAFGAPLSFVAAFFFVQTLRIRFVFEEKEFGIKEAPIWTGKTALEQSGDNYVIGGANRWKYTGVVNYDAFPKWLPFAVLLYFKETQTPKDKWVSNPVGRLANNQKKLDDGAVKGQVHFFPCVCNKDVFKREFEKRGCPKID
mmetsp:Transcript_18390/g.59360  ORF Transcript_18390/g.59360 Transcript_18390/m.59360 type:complete len:253 (-) Transcript_18390:414-1172(-)